MKIFWIFHSYKGTYKPTVSRKRKWEIGLFTESRKSNLHDRTEVNKRLHWSVNRYLQQNLIHQGKDNTFTGLAAFLYTVIYSAAGLE